MHRTTFSTIDIDVKIDILDSHKCIQINKTKKRNEHVITHKFIFKHLGFLLIQCKKVHVQKQTIANTLTE